MAITLRALFYGLAVLFVLLIIYFTYSSSANDEPSYYSPLQKVPPASLEKDVLLDFNNFHYLIDNAPCEGYLNLTVIQIVTSFSGNVEARSAIRRSYSTAELNKMGVVRVFLLAALRPGQSEVTQAALLNENARFHDLIQGNFLESYRNLTYKHTMGLRWVTERCPHAKYVIKMDDDIATDMYELVDHLNENPIEENQLQGYVLRNMQPKRLKANKWYVREDEFSDLFYPTFVSGWLYVTTLKSARKLAIAAQSLRYFWIDDVFITGLAAKKEDFTFLDMKKEFTLHPEVIECCIQFRRRCGFVVGPTGGDYEFHLKFSKHAKACREGKCKPLFKGQTIESRCVSRRKHPPIGEGHAQLSVIKL